MNRAGAPKAAPSVTDLPARSKAAPMYPIADPCWIPVQRYYDQEFFG